MNRSVGIPAILVVLLLIAGVTVVTLYRDRARLFEQRDSLRHEVETLRSELQEAETRVDSLEREIARSEEGSSADSNRDSELGESGLPSDAALRALQRELHVDNPVEFLRRDLLERGEELIDTDAVLGGTMGFHDPGNIHVLNDKWVLAWFEDGHIGGHMLLEFEISQSEDNEKPRVQWERIATHRR